MNPINVKVVRRFTSTPATSNAIYCEICAAGGGTGVKRYGWDRTDLRIRSLSGDRCEVSLNVQLTPTPIKQKTP